MMLRGVEPIEAERWAVGLAVALSLLLSNARTEAQPAAMGGPTPNKSAWQWSVEERLAARFDPAAMAARVAESRAEQRRLKNFDPMFAVPDSPPGTILDEIDGRRHPELFL